MKYFISTLIYLALSISFCFAGIGDYYDLSWLDQDKKIFVLQNRRFFKTNKINISAGAGVTTSGAFVDSINYSGRLSFFFTESMGFEVLYSKNTGEENDTALAVRNPGGAGSTPFRRIVSQYYGGYFSWSPFYAKVNTFNKIIYFDWLINVGVVQMTESNNREEVIAGGVGNFADTEETYVSPSWNMALKFYLNENFDVRLDLVAIHFQAKSALDLSSGNEQWFSHYDASLSLGFRF